MKAIEATGQIDERGQLHLDTPLAAKASGRVRVLLLFDDEDIDEEAWRRAVSHTPAFDFLRDPAVDIYPKEDGKPFMHSMEW